MVAVTPPPLDTELATLELATEDLLDETELLFGLLIELDDELLMELEEMLVVTLLATELVVPQAATTPNGDGWLVHVEREIQLLLFS
jgi:hypothetical protein